MVRLSEGLGQQREFYQGRITILVAVTNRNRGRWASQNASKEIKRSSDLRNDGIPLFII